MPASLLASSAERRVGGPSRPAAPSHAVPAQPLRVLPSAFLTRGPLRRPPEARATVEQESRRCACGGGCPRCTLEEPEVRRTGFPGAGREAEADDATPTSLQAGLDDTRGSSEENAVVEYANGTTTCDRDTGTMSTVINNTACTRPCTEAHEADHRAYRAPCCRTYATARRAAIDAGDTDRRNALTRRYNTWVRTTSDFSECRAHRVGIACGERMESDLGCDTPTDENRTCCTSVRSYLRTMRGHRDSHCPGTDQSCPDFSA